MSVDRVAVVTGANRGIGYEIVRQLSRSGCRVILTARDYAKADQAVRRLGDLGERAVPRQLDVTDPRSVERLAASIHADFGKIDILVNNAAIANDGEQRGIDADLELVHHAVETNLFGPWRLCQAFVPMMRQHNYGRIVNVSSGMGAFGDLAEGKGVEPGYSVSKTALNGLTAMLASELEGTNILVNAVCPGWVRTDMGGPSADLSVEDGADTPVWLALLPDGGPSGGLFRRRQRIPW
ncbi:MAG: short-chain dehydrogenase/reductase [Chloroflexi bacterium]|nr:short-chain dehydrogenase/reductase [Chloroflexota bacterium]